nr:hypothetical protein Iba_chr04dCG12210 [Ipomoea batatas]
MVAAAEQHGGTTGEQRWWIRRLKDRKRRPGWHLAAATTSSEASTAAMVPTSRKEGGGDGSPVKPHRTLTSTTTQTNSVRLGGWPASLRDGTDSTTARRRLFLPPPPPLASGESRSLKRSINGSSGQHAEIDVILLSPKASEKEETGDQSRKQGKLCLELQEKPEECSPKSRQPGTPPETPRSRNHSPGSGEILSYPQEVVGVSPPSPRLKGWGEGLQRYPPLHGRRGPVFFDEASLGEPVRSGRESAVREDQRYPSSSSS